MYGAYVDVAAYNSPSWDVARRSSEDFLHSETLSWLTPDGFPLHAPVPSASQLANPGLYHNSTTCRSCNYEITNNDLTTLDDFILICEVSELEGPKPLVSIPHHAVNDCCVDANALAEKLMSIDYHCSNKGPFDNSQDTQVILSSITDEFHAFSNYFNLYDISARGFVRPMCIAYITTNKRKLVDFFEGLRNNILSVSKCLKYGNRKQFLQDLHLYLQDLQLAKDNYVTTCHGMANRICAEQDQEFNNNCARESAVINQFADNIIEIQHLLSTKKPILDDYNTASLFWKTEMHIKSSFRNNLYQQIKRFVKMEPTHSSKLDSVECNAQCSRLRSVFELCSWGIVIGINALISLQKYYKRDFPTIYMETEDMKSISPCAGAVAFGNHILTNAKSCGSASKSETMSEILTARWEKNLSEIQTIFSYLEQNSSFLNHRSANSSSEFDSDSDEFDDAECDSTYASLGRISNNTSGLTKQTRSSESDNDENLTLTGSCESYRSVLESPLNPSQPISGESELGKVEDEPKSNNLLISLSKHVEFLSPDKPGYGIANVFARLHNFPDILFSLFIGNQVIIAGSSDEEELVRSVVQAFDILVPDKRTSPIAFPWCTSGIKPQDLDRYKLIGLCVPEIRVEALTSFPETTKTQVSVAYVGKNIYVGPVYTGEFLEGLRRISRTDWDDSAFLCYLHSRILSITTRVLLYHKLLTQESSTGSKTGDDDDLLTETQLSIDDISILEYFAAIFKDAIT